MSGVEAALLAALRRKGRMNESHKFIAFGGDGGTYYTGAISVCFPSNERGHDMVYVCYDNEAYMNTGIQRSSGDTFKVRRYDSQSSVAIN